MKEELPTRVLWECDVIDCGAAVVVEVSRKHEPPPDGWRNFEYAYEDTYARDVELCPRHAKEVGDLLVTLLGPEQSRNLEFDDDE